MHPLPGALTAKCRKRRAIAWGDLEHFAHSWLSRGLLQPSDFACPGSSGPIRAFARHALCPTEVGHRGDSETKQDERFGHHHDKVAASHLRKRPERRLDAECCYGRHEAGT